MRFGRGLYRISPGAVQRLAARGANRYDRADGRPEGSAQ
jgi:hypothetical protein